MIFRLKLIRLVTCWCTSLCLLLQRVRLCVWDAELCDSETAGLTTLSWLVRTKRDANDVTFAD